MNNILTAISLMTETVNQLRTLAANETNREAQKAILAEMDIISESANRLSKLPVDTGIPTVDVEEPFSSSLFGSEN